MQTLFECPWRFLTWLSEPCERSSRLQDMLKCLPVNLENVRVFSPLFFTGQRKEKKKALSPAAVLENLRHTLVDYQNRCSNASAEVIDLHLIIVIDLHLKI